jgi:hypothetical protein
MNFYLRDIEDLCEVRPPHPEDDDENGNVASILYISSITALFLIRKIIHHYNFRIVEETENDSYYILKTDIELWRIIIIDENEENEN